METNLKIYEIAEKTGYLNVETFNRAFKRITGKCPSRFIS
jgi:YesN/AraC family two-component response regulator